MHKQVLLYSIENYMQYPMINHNGKDYLKKKNACLYLTESVCYIAEINIMYINYTLIKKLISITFKKQKTESSTMYVFAVIIT